MKDQSFSYVALLILAAILAATCGPTAHAEVPETAVSHIPR